MKLRPILAALALIGALLIPALAGPATASAITCGSAGVITWYESPNAAGHFLQTCADEYPASGSSCSLDQTFCKFNDGSSADNRIDSIGFSVAHAGTCVHVFTGYYFAGTRGTFCKPTSGSQVVNMPATFSNSISSLLSCGQDGCADNP